MKILLLHQYFLEKDDGGGSRFNEMTQVWAGMGHRITVIAGMVHYSTGKKATKYKGKWTHYEKNFYPGVDVIRSHVSESYNLNFAGRLWAYLSFVVSGIWAGLFRAGGKYDVILVTSPPLFIGITAYVLSKLKRTPYVFEIRDLWPESAIDSEIVTNKLIIRFAYWFEKFIYKHAKLINVLTPAFRTNLLEKKNIPDEKIIFIPNAADFSLYDKLLNEFDSEAFRKKEGLEDRFVITYVGAHGVANHLIQLVDAAEQLQETKLLFQLIGDGMQKKMLMEEVEKRKLKNIRFISSVPKQEVFKYILASDVGTSVLKRTDTYKTIYSNKTFDYMACKKPVLLLIDGVSRELVEKADCGIYAEPENINDIVDKLKIVMNTWDKETLEIKGNNGYSYAKLHFDRFKLAHDYISLISRFEKKR